MVGRLVILALVCCAGLAPLRAAQDRIELRHVALDLPGPPARVLPADLDRDGRQDLVVVVAYTEIEQISEDRVEEMIQVTRVIPTLFDRREARAYLATDGGEYRLAGPPLELPVSVLHLETGPPGIGPVALTDEGLSALRFRAGSLVLVPLVAERPILAGTRRFFPNLRLVCDLDGDGADDVMLPTLDSIALFLGDGEGFHSEPVQRVRPPRAAGGDPTRDSSVVLALPEIELVDGDALPDLVFRGAVPGRGEIDVHRGMGGGRFEPLRLAGADCHDRLTDLRLAGAEAGSYPWPDDVAAFQDLDGDGRAEIVVAVGQSRGDSWRKELKDAKRPIHDYRFHRLTADGTVEGEPYFETRVVGHSMDGDLRDDEDGGSPLRFEQFVDLDGDGRDDLVTVTFEFSVFQVIKTLATKRIGIGFNFHVYAQGADGSFVEVPDLDLSEKLKLNLNNLEIGRFAQFAGDFDGDRRQDFVHLGRGTHVTIHRGRAGCRYPKDADLAIELEEEPPSLDLVRIEDLDGDGRADIRITRPLVSDDPDLTAPARLDLYLSTEER